jgi:TolA-binding protein
LCGEVSSLSKRSQRHASAFQSAVHQLRGSSEHPNRESSTLDRWLRNMIPKIESIPIKEMRMNAANNRSTDEAQIRDLVEGWARAVRSKNIDGILANHSPEILMFDVPPPAQSKGMEAYKKTWDVFFAWFQDSGVFDIAS